MEKAVRRMAAGTSTTRGSTNGTVSETGANRFWIEREFQSLL
jgi:hypothetical protein